MEVYKAYSMKMKKFTSEVRQNPLVRYFRKTDDESESICRQIGVASLNKKSLQTLFVITNNMG